MQQFCLKDSPLSDKEEEKQPSSQEISYLKPSRLHQSSLQSPSLQLSSPNTSSPQPSSLQVLRKPSSHLENHPTFLSPRDQITSSNSPSPTSLPVSSRFVSKTTISLGGGDGGGGGGGDELSSPPILYSPNNSVTCGVRPSSSGGVRLAINSSGGEGGAAPGGVPAHRLGPKPWAGGGEVRLIDNSAGVSRIKISPSSGSSYSRSPARVSIGSFSLSSPSKEMEASPISLHNHKSEKKSESLGFSF